MRNRRRHVARAHTASDEASGGLFLGALLEHRLEADLAKAMLSWPATKGFELGSGFAGARMRGSVGGGGGMEEIMIGPKGPIFKIAKIAGIMGAK